MSNADRAKQFLPFDALKGFYKMVRRSEFVIEDKVYLDSDGINELLFKLNQVKKGMMVEIKYYLNDHYETKEGLVSQIDYFHKTITLVKTKIYIEDIIDIKGDGISEVEIEGI